MKYGLVAIEQFHRVLGEIAHLHTGTDRDRTIIGVGSAGNELQQGGFPGAVHAQNAPALLAADAEIEPIVNDPLAIGLADVLQRRDIIARAGWRLEFEHHALAALGWFHAVDLFELLHPALHLRSVTGTRLEALDEGKLLCKHGLLALELRCCCFSASARCCS